MKFKQSYWRGRAAEIIAKVLMDMRGKPDAEVKRALFEAYPFGERENHPYKIWLDEIKRQTGKKWPIGHKIAWTNNRQRMKSDYQKLHEWEQLYGKRDAGGGSMADDKALCNRCGCQFVRTASQIQKHTYTCMSCRVLAQKQLRAYRVSLGLCRRCGINEVQPTCQLCADCYRKYHGPREAIRANGRKSYQKNKASITAYRMSYRAKHPERYAAKQAVNYAVKTGKLVRPDRCEKCHRLATVQAHHEDYTRKLSIQWLCPSCHKKADRERLAAELKGWTK